MVFEQLADARLVAGWSSVKLAIETLFSEPTPFVDLLLETYAELDEIQRKLYLFSPQLVARIGSGDELDSALLFEPPRVPDHRQGLEQGLKVLLTWLVSHQRSTEAQAWAQLSRVLLENLHELDYLHKGAQVSLFCVGERTSRYYLNLQPLKERARYRILEFLGAVTLYEKALPVLESGELSLGGLGVEMLPSGYRTKLYVRGQLSILLDQVAKTVGNFQTPEMELLGQETAFHRAMEAEIALERGPADALRCKWVYFIDRPERGVEGTLSWLAQSRHRPRVESMLKLLGGPKSLFALGAEFSGEDVPQRVNVYARHVR